MAKAMIISPPLVNSEADVVIKETPCGADSLGVLYILTTGGF